MKGFKGKEYLEAERDMLGDALLGAGCALIGYHVGKDKVENSSNAGKEDFLKLIELQEKNYSLTILRLIDKINAGDDDSMRELLEEIKDSIQEFIKKQDINMSGDAAFSKNLSEILERFSKLEKTINDLNNRI